MSMGKKILYLGTDPGRFKAEGDIDHVPLIRIEPIRDASVREAFSELSSCDAVVLTSRNSVQEYFYHSTDYNKLFMAIGKGTAELIIQRGLMPLIAKEETAEGICCLIESIKPNYVFFPHAQITRGVIQAFLSQKQIPYRAVICYKTQSIIPDPIPVLSAYDEIILTSSSCVRAFFKLYGHMPSHLSIKTQGPITQATLNEYLK